VRRSITIGSPIKIMEESGVMIALILSMTLSTNLHHIPTKPEISVQEWVEMAELEDCLIEQIIVYFPHRFHD